MVKTITDVLWTKVLTSDALFPTLSQEEKKIPNKESLNKIFLDEDIKELHTTEKTGILFQGACVVRALARQVCWFAIGIISSTASIPYHGYQAYRHKKGKEHAWALLKDLRIGGFTTLTLYAIPYLKKNWRIKRADFKKLPFKERFLTVYSTFGIAISSTVSWNPQFGINIIKDKSELKAFWVSLVLKRYFGIISKEGTLLNTDHKTDRFNSFLESPNDPSLLSTSLWRIYYSSERSIFHHIDDLRQHYPDHCVPYPPTPSNYQPILQRLLDQELNPEKKQFIQNWGKTLEKYHRTLNIIALKIFFPIETFITQRSSRFYDFHTSESMMRDLFTSFDEARKVREEGTKNLTPEATKALYVLLSNLSLYPSDREKDGDLYEFSTRLSQVTIPHNLDTIPKHSLPAVCPFKLLGVEENAQSSDVNKIYKRLVLLTHPDKVDKKNIEENVETYEEKLFKVLNAVKALADLIINQREQESHDDGPHFENPKEPPLIEGGVESETTSLADLD